MNLPIETDACARRAHFRHVFFLFVWLMNTDSCKKLEQEEVISGFSQPKSIFSIKFDVNRVSARRHCAFSFLFAFIIVKPAQQPFQPNCSTASMFTLQKIRVEASKNIERFRIFRPPTPASDAIEPLSASFTNEELEIVSHCIVTRVWTRTRDTCKISCSSRYWNGMVNPMCGSVNLSG